MAVADLDEARRAAGVGPDDTFPPDDSASVAERAEEEPTAMELFPLGTVEGDERTVKTLIRGGMATEVTVSLMSAEIDSPHGGLLDAEKAGQLVVSYEVAKYMMIPQREGEPGNKRVVSWKIRQQIRPTYVQNGRMYTREEVLDIIEKLGASDRPDIGELLGD